MILTPLLTLLGLSAVIGQRDGDTYTDPPTRKWTVNDEEVCLGTTNGRTAAGMLTTNTRYEVLLKSFVRCKRIIGNLEITHIDPKDFDGDVDLRNVSGRIVRDRREPFWFLEDLEEITGYLLIYNLNHDSIDLPKLRIIWGEQLHEGMALHIDSSPNLKYVNLPALREIHSGKLTIRRSDRLCYFKHRVDFTEIMGPGYAKRVEFVPDDERFNCPLNELKCSSACEGNCFGPTKKQCQTIYRRKCGDCPSGQCYGDGLCCNDACLGGCTGPGDQHCVACRNYEEDGRCVAECRGTSRYNQTLMIMEPMPDRDKRFYYERHCVPECPSGTLIEDRYCVARCSPGKFRDAGGDDRHCVPCDGPCPKVCAVYEPINAETIKALVNCSEIEGNVEILNHVFDSHLALPASTSRRSAVRMVPALKAEDLDVLKSVRIVTGHVALDGGQSRTRDIPRSLDFLQNLEVIEGRTLYYKKYAIYVIGSVNFHSIGLKSLKRIHNGGVSLTNNENLCYGKNIPFGELYGVKEVLVKNNMNGTTCVCDPTCDPHFGCWGPGPSQCVKCLNFTKDGYCSETCPTHAFYFVPSSHPQQCMPCADECLQCNGPTGSDCTQCRFFEMPRDAGQKTRCVRECPSDTFPVGKRCVRCAPECYHYGCTGNGTHVGQGGCNRCLFAVEEQEDRLRCLVGDDEQTICSHNDLPNYYLTLATGKNKLTRFVCERCPDECRSCTRQSLEVGDCTCSRFRLTTFLNETLTPVTKKLPTDVCTLSCGFGSRLLRNSTDFSREPGICERCNDLCSPEHSCAGPTQLDCDVCRVGGVVNEDGLLECLPECPEDRPFAYLGLCREEDTAAILARRRNLIIGVVIAVFVAVSTLILYLISRCTKYRKKYEKEALMHMPEIPELDRRKLTQRPNMGRFTLISTDELDDAAGRNVLGQGAFGIVYAGKWKPPGKNTSIPVAIKAINPAETRNVTEGEMLREAGVMGQVRHEHLLPLVGVCFAKGGLKIVTILRPLGSLLSFLHQYRQRLAAKQLVLYQFQIASAMEFLARKKIVHRDLAARNVLVKNINHVEVTDFGLAQLLANNEQNVVVKEGRVAVKWLAIESLRTHVFNERTDVWAYGVTCWEIMTFGEPPYKELHQVMQVGNSNQTFAQQFADLLERGHRLKQPLNCAQELYQELLNCWLNDPDSRPAFRQIKEKFENFCRAPHLYVQDRQAVNQMDSISDSDQRAIIERLLQDSDFENPLELDPADYRPTSQSRNRVSENTVETFLPDTPTSSVFGQRNPFRSSTSRTISQSSRPARLTDEKIVDIDEDDNYLQPRNSQDKEEPPALVYTPVVVNDDSPTHEYTNDPYQTLLDQQKAKQQNAQVETAF